MPKPKQSINPFYFLVILAGIAFAVTACAFGMLMLRAIRPEGPIQPGQSGYGLMDLLDHQGTTILCVELAVLGAATIGAVGLDHVRGQRDSDGTEPTNEAVSPKDEPSGEER